MDEGASQKKIKEEVPKGIGGWLIIPMIIFFMTALYFGFITLFIIGSVFYGNFPKVSLFQDLAFISIFFIIAYSLFLEFKKKKSFPKWAIISSWIITILVFLSVGKIISFISIFIGLSWTIIWTIYFIRSKRVKNTFVK